MLTVTINALWGGNVPAVKFGLRAVPPLWSAFWRFVLGTGCIGAWATVKGVPLRPQKGEWGALLLLGALFTVQIALMNIGIHFTSGAMASILIAANPLFAAAAAHVILPDDRLTPARTLGLAVAFGGILLVFLPGVEASGGESTLLGNLVCLSSAALLGGRLVFASRLLRRMESTRVMMWQMALSLPVYALAGWSLEQVNWEALGWEPLLGIAYQGFVVAGFNFMAMAWLLQRHRASLVFGFNFISPLSGVVLSAWLLGDELTWHILAGMIAVGLGLGLITRR